MLLSKEEIKEVEEQIMKNRELLGEIWDLGVFGQHKKIVQKGCYRSDVFFLKEQRDRWIEIIGGCVNTSNFSCFSLSVELMGKLYNILKNYEWCQSEDAWIKKNRRRNNYVK